MPDSEITNKVSRAVSDLAADWERCDGVLERADVDRLYLKRGLDPDDCIEVERALTAKGIFISDPEDENAEAESGDMETFSEPSAPRNNITLLIKDTRRHRLLTRQEERELGRAVRLANAFTGSEASSTAAEIQRRGRQAFDRLVACNIRLVVKIAHTFRPSIGMSSDDIVQEGMMGLLRAVEKFDPELGFKFSTYATWWIKQSIHRGIHDKARLIRLPVHVEERLNKYERMRRRIATQTGDADPSPAVVAEALGWDDERGLQACLKLESLRLLGTTESLDAPIGEDGSATLGESIPSPHPDPEHILMGQEVTQKIRAAVAGLPNDRAITVIKQRFGLDGPEQTLEQIGKRYHLTRERIRQVEFKALTALRHPARSKLLKKLLD